MDIDKLIEQLLTTDYGGVEVKRQAFVRLLQDPELIQQALRNLVPRPGSTSARAMACQCPILDNQDREGTGTYVITSQCPLHWHKKP